MAWAPDYMDLETFKERLKIPALVTDDDDTISSMLTAASRAIDTDANRQFGKLAAPATFTYRARYFPDRRRWVADIDDLTDVTGLTVVNSDGDAITGYRLEPVGALTRGRAYETISIRYDNSTIPVWPEYELDVTASFGWTTTPGTIVAATFLQTSRFFARRESPYGVAGSPDLGSEVRLLAKLDPDVAVQVAAYARRRRAR